MHIHNLLEEIVTARVNDLFEEIKHEKAAWFTCGCPQCKIDTVCYVLNKLPPRYIVSSRGVTYSQQDTFSNQQLAVDIDSIIINGMKQIMSTRRPHYQILNNPDMAPGKPVFNFPTIVGKIINGQTFEPVYDVDVLLKINGTQCEMFDTTWANPYRIVKNTPGTFAFWPKSLITDSDVKRKLFSFELSVKAAGFEAIDSYFDLDLTAETEPSLFFNAQDTYKIQNLYIFPC